MADNAVINMLMGNNSSNGSPFFGAQPPLTAPYPMMPQQTNLPQATADMNLSPQEQALYMRHITNLYGPGGVDNAPTPDNPQGSRSTLYQTVEPHNGQFYNIPTVWNGNKEIEPYTRPDGSTLDVANSTALNNVAKAGWNTFPSYPTAEQADARYGKMHDYMDKDTGAYYSAGMSQSPQSVNQALLIHALMNGARK